jgi:hypothetical protein
MTTSRRSLRRASMRNPNKVRARIVCLIHGPVAGTTKCLVCCKRARAARRAYLAKQEAE